MAVKTCFRCGETLPLSSFYPHKSMKDGRLNKCRDCTKADVATHRRKHIKEIRAYDRSRGNRQDPSYMSMYRDSNPEKYRAHIAVGNAVRAGRLVRQPCEVCGRAEVHAHHDDYSRPLDVRWLCPACHAQHHAKHDTEHPRQRTVMANSAKEET